MNTNSIPNTNSVEPQVAERLQNIYCAELSGWCLRECGDVFRSWCIQLGESGGRDVGACHLPCGGQMLGWALPGNIHPVPLRGTSRCSEKFSKYKDCKSFWILKLGVLFNRTLLQISAKVRNSFLEGRLLRTVLGS